MPELSWLDGSVPAVMNNIEGSHIANTMTPEFSAKVLDNQHSNADPFRFSNFQALEQGSMSTIDLRTKMPSQSKRKNPVFSKVGKKAERFVEEKHIFVLKSSQKK